jgi:hypothetical protein
MKINRAIVSCDKAPLYHHFWEIVAKAWTNIGIKPTLASVDGYEPKETCGGDIIKLQNIPNLSSAYISQVIRLFMPVFFPDDVCIISDIDMLPLSKKYFLDTVKDIEDDKIVIYSSDAYRNTVRYPICYIAAKGSVFREILGLKNDSMEGIIAKLIEWHSQDLGWDTDELMFTKALREWDKFDTHTVMLKRGGWKPTAHRRVDRQNSFINPLLLFFNYYIDVHMQRPFSEEKLNLLIKKISK